MGATTAGVACPTALLVIGGGLDFSIGATFAVGAAVS
jgi:ribose/xylose/arabinose/galactoside ABC-type transport system permease subunit